MKRPAVVLADVEAICRHVDPVLRNLRITQAYHELSAGLAAWAGEAANWCTFATWASRQAGQTIRREDLARTLEAGLGGAYFFSANLGIGAELDFSLFYGAATIERAVTAIPVASLALGVFFDWEHLP